MKDAAASLDAALTSFWDSLESKHSRRGYKHDWGCYATWLDSLDIEPSRSLCDKVLAAKPSDVQRYVTYLRDERQIAKPTRARALSVIRCVYDALLVDGLVDDNPARGVKSLKADARPKTPWLDETALERLTATLDADRDGDWRARRDRLCVLLFIGIGWRRSEIARMRFEDFSPGWETVTGVVKGKKSATVPVPVWLRKEIDDWHRLFGETGGPLLPRWLNKRLPISDSYAYDIVKAAACRAGFPPEAVTPHGLRRTLITLSGERGVSLKDRQKAVAHSSSHTTERYDHAPGRSAPGEVLADLIYGSKPLKLKNEDEGP